MSDNRYYPTYENRYQAVFSAGATHWSFTADDLWLMEALTLCVDAQIPYSPSSYTRKI